MNMKYLSATLFAVNVLLLPGTAFSQLKQNTSSGEQLNLTFNIKAGDATVVPGNTYTNPFGETYTVQKFRFYIAQILLEDSTNTSEQFFPDDYFLVDAGDTGSRTITVPISIKHLTAVSFLVGVDSVANVSGTQTGALDPANGMFWTWNTGYIMLKLDGTSPAAKVPGNAFSLHVGGYKTGENATRKIGYLIRHSQKQAVHNIVFNVDINKLFNGAYPIKIAEHPLCHQPGALAMQLADNYATMFSLGQVSK